MPVKTVSQNFCYSDNKFTHHSTFMNYLITLSGNGAEIGVGKISKAQFDFWSKPEQAENLNWEIQGGLDDDEIPDEVRLAEHYEYMDVYCQSGVYESSLEIDITAVDDEDDEEFSFSGEYDEFVDDFTFDGQEPILEKSVKYPKKKDHYIAWIAEESGTLLEEEIELEDGEVFDPKKIKLIYTTINPQLKLITGVEYDGYSLSEYTDDFEKSGEMEAQVFKHG
jgi:hypothetical protein